MEKINISNNLNENTSNKILSKLRNLKFAIPATLALYFSGCENPENRSKMIENSLKLNPEKVEMIDPIKIQDAENIFNEFKEKMKESGLNNLNNGLEHSFVKNDSTMEIVKFPKNVYEYTFSDDGTMKVVWSKDNQDEIFSGEGISTLNSTGNMIIDKKTGVIMYYDESDFSNQPEYHIDNRGWVFHRIEGGGKGSLAKKMYKENTAKNFLNEHISDFDLIKNELKNK